MATLTTLTLDADGTLDTTNLAHDTGTGTPWYTHCNDTPNGVSTDFVRNNGGLADGSYFAWFSLSNVNSDFGSMTTLNIDVDVQASGFSNDLCTLTARIADGNGSSTWLTDESGTLGSEADTTRTQRNVSFANLAGTKSQWDSAYIRFAWNYDRVGAADGSAVLRLYGTDIDGTYALPSAVKNLGLLGVG